MRYDLNAESVYTSVRERGCGFQTREERERKGKKERKRKNETDERRGEERRGKKGPRREERGINVGAETKGRMEKQYEHVPVYVWPESMSGEGNGKRLVQVKGWRRLRR